MKIKTYTVLSRAIEEGIEIGYNRAFKHTNSPTKEQMVQEIYINVMNQISEIMDFDEIDQETICLQENKHLL